MSQRRRIEVCVDSIESALAAVEGGADRLEVCSALGEGGLTPSAGLLEVLRERVRIPLAVMIRPRCGDFCPSDDEFEVMRRDLVRARAAGADLIVLGLLTPAGDVDVTRTRELIALARPLPVTFHRAFDMTRDPHASLEALIGLGCERVLTSGQEKTALEGLDLLVDLVRQAADRIVVMPGGGITERNLPRILRECDAREFHVSASGSRDSRMEFRNTRIPMGRTLSASEYTVPVADAVRVARFRDLAGTRE
ncbi:MAG: copper homeostasis protein CutC [Verrucomicrobia bacterium]|nr:copper homeostasis protein CutC [Verrucomicrobiota bacterium]